MNRVFPSLRWFWERSGVWPVLALAGSLIWLGLSQTTVIIQPKGRTQEQAVVIQQVKDGLATLERIDKQLDEMEKTLGILSDIEVEMIQRRQIADKRLTELLTQVKGQRKALEDSNLLLRRSQEQYIKR